MDSSRQKNTNAFSNQKIVQLDTHKYCASALYANCSQNSKFTYRKLANRFGMEYNSGSGGDFQSPGGSQGGGARKATDEQTLIPVTIKMLLEAIPNNKILLDGREPYHVKLVAAVTTVNKTSTSYGYTVEDGTGTIEVKEWIDEGNLEITKMREEAAQDHQYVRIIGKLEEYDGKAQIVAVAVRKLSSGNELTHHLLEVVHEGEKYKKSGQIVGSPSAAMGNMSFGSNNMHSSEPITNTGASTGGGLESEVMTYLRNVTSEEGGSVDNFTDMNKGKYSLADVKAVFENLANEGIVYSTVDESHYSLI